jgi:hypothetical protein
MTLSSLALVVALAGCSSSDDSITGPSPAPTPTPAAPTSDSVFEVRGDAQFLIDNLGSSDYLFSWTDANGTFAGVEDPTLILESGRTYTFRRVSGAHPFRITTSALPVSGSDGEFVRATTDGNAIDAVSLQPLDAFTADPAPTSDAITWVASEGDYFYTCRVTGHPAMTGALRVRAAQ